MISAAVIFRARSTRTEPTRLDTPAAPDAAAPNRGAPAGRLRQLAMVPVAAACLAALGCASGGSLPGELPDVASAPPGPALLRTGGLLEVDTHNRGVFFVRPDHQLGRYDEILIEHVGFRYSEHQKWLSYREEDRISAILASAVQGNQDGAIGLAKEPGPCVLGVRFFVTDLELYDAGYGAGSRTSFVHSFGEATMIMELRDSQSEETLARFVQRRKLGGGPGSDGSGTSIRRLATVVGAAMQDIGQQITKITPPTTQPWEGQCKGGMTRVAFGSH